MQGTKKRFYEKNKKVNRNFDTSLDEILTQSSPWPVQEAYKALRTNVVFSIPGSGCKVIGICSSMMHEGKSINAINLALSFAQLGKKTLLIDCDLRKPTVAMRLKIKNQLGLSNLLTGQCRASEAFVRLPKFGIDVLAAGSIPPDPTWLLASNQMDQLLANMRERYDIIIIDMPPVMSVSDALIMSKNVDGYILVIRHNFSDFRAIDDAMTAFKRADAKVIGFLYNDVTQGRKGYRKSYYYNSYYYYRR